MSAHPGPSPSKTAKAKILIVTLDDQSRVDLSTVATHKWYVASVTGDGTITLRPVVGTELPTLDEVRQRTVRIKETSE